MKKNILKRAMALGCLTLALFCVVKKEEENKRPIIMKQLAVAEEVVEPSEYISDELYSVEEVAQFQEENLTVIEEVAPTGGEALKEENGLAEVEPQEKQEQSIIEYEIDENLSIMVVGKAHTSLSPDVAVIYARIETKEGDIDSAKENNLEIFDNVVSVLTEKGLDKNNIKLEHFNCMPCYEFSLSRSISGYSSSTSFSVELPAIENIEEYLSLLTENGVCCIDNICYKVSNMEEEYNNALAQAVENARVKAEKMSGGQELTLVKVKEEGVHSISTYARTCCEDVKLSDYVGQIEISATVVAVFEK